MIKMFTVAHLPDELLQAWLQHVRDFDTKHPNCHFEMMADAPSMSLAEMIVRMKVEPELTFSKILERRDG